MHPVCGKGLIIGALTLCNFIFMVREDQIFAPCMDINRISQIALCHHRALNMPARTALAPWRLPVRLSLFLGLPEHKIIRVFLAFFTRYLNLTKARLKLIQVFVGQLAIFCKGTRLKVHRAVLCHIGVSLVDQGLDHIDHALNLLSCLRMYRSRLHIHILHILFALCNIALGNNMGIYAFFIGLFDDFVVHIRKVGNKFHLISLVFKIPAHSVKHDHGTGISDMDQIVYRRAAHIHFHLSRCNRLKFFFSPG